MEILIISFLLELSILHIQLLLELNASANILCQLFVDSGDLLVDEVRFEC